MSQAEDLYDVCRAGPRVFVLHPDLKRANFYFQQLRGLALVRQMAARGDLRSTGGEVIVVGSGIAGMTIAAAALTAGNTVTLIDKADPLKQYREASHRELHPNIIAWPFQDPRGMTKLPFLNWSCGSAPSVCEQVLEQWRADFHKHVASVRDEVAAIDEDANGVTVRCAKAPYRGDVVIVAVGFRGERSLKSGPFRGPSYWITPPFEEDDTPGAPPREIFVSGSGDGGLIDAAYQIYGPNAVAASRALAYLLHEKPHKKRVDAAEREALAHADAGRRAEAFEHLQNFYSTLRLENEDQSTLESFERPHRFRSRLFYVDPSAYSPTVAPINKVMMSHLCRAPSARVTPENAVVDEVGVKVTATALPPATTCEELDRNFLLVRHGAEHAAWPILSDAHIKTLKGVDQAKLNDVVEDTFDEGFYVAGAERALAPSPLKRPEIFYERAGRLLHKMIRHVTNDDPTVNFKRDRNAWTVYSGPTAHRLLRGLFPLQVGAVTVELTVATHPVFE